MKTLFTASLLLLIPMAATAQPKPDITRYDQNGDGKIDRAEYAVLLKHQQNPTLAKCDNKKPMTGYFDTPVKQACQKAELDENARPLLQDVDDRFSGPLTLDEARNYSGYDKPKPKPLLPAGMFIRDAYTPGAVLTAEPLKRQKTVGARVAYAHYRDTDEYSFNGSGALIYQQRWTFDAPKDYVLGTPRIWGIGLSPSLEFNRTKTNRTGVRDTNYLGLFATAEIAATEMPLFREQLFRVGAYQKTDFDGVADVPGVFAEWQPLHSPLGLGVTDQIPGTNLNYYFGPVFRFEAERVNDRGILSTQLARGDYTRAGGILQSKLYFSDGPLQNFSLNAKYWMLASLTSDPLETDRRYFQGNLLYNLDPDGHFAIDFMYRKGQEPGLGQRVNDFTVGLSAKY